MSDGVDTPPPCTEWQAGPVVDTGPGLDDSRTFCEHCGYPWEEHINPFGKPDSCTPCTLYREPGMVRGVGPDHPKILFVGEGPGEVEVDQPYFRRYRFKPFIGGSGRLFSSLCQHAGINRNETFVTNVIKCHAPGDRLPTELEIQCCAPFLVEEIESKNPNILVALGEVALNVLTDKEGISLHRGVPLEGFAGRKVFPTWHPAFIARAQYNRPFAVHDLVRAKAESEFPEVRRIPFNIIRNASATTHGEATLAAARARGAATFDFETTGLSSVRDSIAMVGVAARPEQAEVYDWTPATAQFFQTLLDDPQIEIVGQNILYFDLPFAEEKGINIDKAWAKVFDTIVTFHLANSSYGQTPVHEQNAGTYRNRGVDKDLAMIASCHTDIPYWKSRENYQKDLRGVCGLDVIATDRSALHPATGLKQELKQYDMLDLYYKHVLPVHPILHKMSKRGVRIHPERAVTWAVAFDKQANELEATLREGLGQPDLNLNSPKQLMELLYGRMGLPTQLRKNKKTGQWRPSADAEAVETLAAMYPEHAVVGTIKDIRYCRKMRSTYIEPALQGNWRLHPRFGVSKASTGRFNSWDPNAQNQPEEIRDIWIADDDDCVLLSSDWSQIEWRLAVILSGDPAGLELLASGADNHSAIAAETMGKVIGPNDNGTCDHPECQEHVTEDDRYDAKFIVYGLGYGRGADSISKGHSIPLPRVEQFIARFMNRFKVFAGWRERNLEFVKHNQYLANAFKRRRWWYTWQVTEVYNFPQQSTAADMMYDALIGLDRELPKESTLRLTVHDDVVINTPKSAVKKTWECVRNVMQMTWPQIVEASADPAIVKRFYPNGWYCPADIHIGTDWGMCKSKDPEIKAARAALEKHLGVGGKAT